MSDELLDRITRGLASATAACAASATLATEFHRACQKYDWARAAELQERSVESMRSGMDAVAAAYALLQRAERGGS